ncbi:TonB-dependent receptor [Acetobacter sp. AN02]|nr:TonB-dependent receptor [Acetobacter sp. AN02]
MVSARFSLAVMLMAGCCVSPALAASVQSDADSAKKKEEAGVSSSVKEDILVRAQRRNRMEVSGGGQLGALGTKKGLDVPFNIRSYNSSIILNQQAQTLGEVLDNDPTVRTTLGYGNFSEMFIVRGLPVYGDDIAIDGLYGVVPRQLVSPQPYDQVQILNGASAFLNGAAPSGTAIGGNINLLLKKAEKTDLSRLTANYTSNGQGGGAADFSRRFGRDKAFGFRLNAAGMDGQTAIDHERRHDVAVSGTLDWHSDATRISLSMNYQNQYVRQGRGEVFLGTDVGVPRAAAPSVNFSPRWTYADLNYLFGVLSAEHDFGKHITVYGAFGGLSSDEKGNYSNLTVTDAATGDGTLGSMYVPYQQTNESMRAGMRAHFDTGPVKHEINAGGSSLWEHQSTAYSMFFNPSSPVYGNLYSTSRAEAPVQNWIGGNTKNPTRSNYSNLWSLFFSDTMSFWHDRIALTGGFRYQRIYQNSYNYSGDGSRSSHYDEGAFTPVVGLVVHPTRRTSIYFNRIEGLAQGQQASGNVVNLGQVFSPTRSLQYEVGVKYDTGRFMTSLAFYQVTQPNSYTEAFGDSGQMIFRMDGQQRNRGMELTVNGEIVRGLRFNGGITLIDADLRRTAGGVNDGNTAIGVPNYSINGNLEYDLPFLKGVTLVGRVVNTGKQWVNVGNTAHLPVWTRFDLGTRYTFLVARRALTARFGVDNLANSRYWASAFNGYLTQGTPRTFKFSLTADL